VLHYLSSSTYGSNLRAFSYPNECVHVQHLEGSKVSTHGLISPYLLKDSVMDGSKITHNMRSIRVMIIHDSLI